MGKKAKRGNPFVGLGGGSFMSRLLPRLKGLPPPPHRWDSPKQACPSACPASPLPFLSPTLPGLDPTSASPLHSSALSASSALPGLGSLHPYCEVGPQCQGQLAGMGGHCLAGSPAAIVAAARVPCLRPCSAEWGRPMPACEGGASLAREVGGEEAPGPGGHAFEQTGPLGAECENLSTC